MTFLLRKIWQSFLHMLVLILIATACTILDLALQLGMISACINFLAHRGQRFNHGKNQWRDLFTMAVVLLSILASHLLQIAVWAFAFVCIGEFDTFKEAYYHSSVNFTTLGYGDVVMSQGWRLLGSLEAAVGMLMFGVSTALLFAILGKIVRIRFKDTSP